MPDPNLRSLSVVVMAAVDFTEEEVFTVVAEDFMEAGSRAAGFTVGVVFMAEEHSAEVFVEAFAEMAFGAVSASEDVALVGEDGAGVGA